MAATAQLSVFRLERLFSRKRSAHSSPSTTSQSDSSHRQISSRRTVSSSSSSSSSDPEPLFPSPSFIKPTTSRMVARDEVTPAKTPSRLTILTQNSSKHEPSESGYTVVSPVRKTPNPRYSNCSGSSGSTFHSALSVSTSPSTVYGSECGASPREYTPASPLSSRRSRCNIPKLTFQFSPNPESEYSSSLGSPPLSPGFEPLSPNCEPRPSFCSSFSINSYLEGGKLESFPHPPRPATPVSETNSIVSKSPSPARQPMTKRIVARGPAPDFSLFSFSFRNESEASTDTAPSSPLMASKLPHIATVVSQQPKPMASRPHIAALTSRPLPAPPSTTETRNMYTGIRRSSSVSGVEFMYTKASISSVRPKTSASADGILREPSVNDFMDLDDEDIAEETPAVPTKAVVTSKPKTAAPTSKPTSVVRLAPESKARARAMTNTKRPAPSDVPEATSSLEASLLTLKPPMCSRPATLAALMAARIATRYDFSLVYVVNLWPTSSDPLATPTGSQISMSDSTPRLTGRLLAAYGLECVQSPFRISSVVHSKILQSEEWIEYSCPEIHEDEFSQGYARSFFTGQYGRRKSETDASPLSAHDSMTRRNIDRGIVFAAYRKPSRGQPRRPYSKAKLDELQMQAEGLVGMLMDVHFTSSLQSASLFEQHFEETGPMPAHTPHIC
ncbi:hypothetical protein TD95_001821 [Thielaviopsis punctulata]|uniref:Uncharacterized protein n=1 Tax=Thielaviopsis punctulata TaxID=72032 RepID=A0A0F4ZAD8_9PEZI|nr:hypothetical protein TD95_001821 [Thielaviopsis punctulata]